MAVAPRFVLGCHIWQNGILLLLTSEKSSDSAARQEREAKKEAHERAQYFKGMGTKEMSLER
jgi:hypothetical protein